MLYTLIPQELIFSNQVQQKRELIEISGGLLEVEATENREFRIVRLISSDPSLYLDERYAPGTLISLSPKFSS